MNAWNRSRILLITTISSAVLLSTAGRAHAVDACVIEDGLCDYGEDCVSCPQDCGSCDLINVLCVGCTTSMVSLSWGPIAQQTFYVYDLSVVDLDNWDVLYVVTPSCKARFSGREAEIRERVIAGQMAVVVGGIVESSFCPEPEGTALAALNDILCSEDEPCPGGPACEIVQEAFIGESMMLTPEGEIHPSFTGQDLEVPSSPVCPQREWDACLSPAGEARVCFGVGTACDSDADCPADSACIPVTRTYTSLPCNAAVLAVDDLGNAAAAAGQLGLGRYYIMGFTVASLGATADERIWARNAILHAVLPGVLTVDIDIKPGNDPNSIQCNNPKGVIAVAILTTEDFDATTVDHSTVLFEGASETHGPALPYRHEEDADGDGDLDLVIHVRFGETDEAFDCEATIGTLTGQTYDGQPVEGTDAVKMINMSKRVR